tara:strand:+ start:849 stop:965 length:117 start_codon:yes stop_codon:yes gene_type:complete
MGGGISMNMGGLSDTSDIMMAEIHSGSPWALDDNNSRF